MRKVNYYYGYTINTDGTIDGFCTNEYDTAVFYKDFQTVLEDVQEEDNKTLQAHREKVAEKFGLEI